MSDVQVWVQASVAGATGDKLRHLALIPRDGPMDPRDLVLHTGFVDEVSGSQVVTGIDDDVPPSPKDPIDSSIRQPIWIFYDEYL